MLRRVFATQGVAPGRRRLATRQAILLRDFVLKGRTEPSGSVVTVSAGYLRNFMFPRQIAIPATRANLAAAAARADAAGPAEPAAAVEPPPDPRAQTIKPSARTLQRDSR
jgi:ribosomal protein L9